MTDDRWLCLGICGIVKIILTAETLLDIHSHGKIEKIFLSPYMLVWDQYEALSKSAFCCWNPTYSMWSFLPPAKTTTLILLPWSAVLKLAVFIWAFSMDLGQQYLLLFGFVFVFVCVCVHSNSQCPNMNVYLPMYHPCCCCLRSLKKKMGWFDKSMSIWTRVYEDFIYHIPYSLTICHWTYLNILDLI